MHLKKIEMQGFKSFPDKIILEFNKGITSVVGPNGSGKSNIADAIRWVLGEQSIKTLRGSKMEDVIFSGTEHRKPLGFAEVSLTIDNAEGVLPVEYGEVTVTRRVFRSGESEYFINKAPCRLKDINELLIDTGLGKDGYSVIGQGRIDEILSARSEDRRNVFEEASGIMKYRIRRNEAEKKLESAKQNLLRINDVINELELQLEPLRQQAETARKYLSLRDNLKDIEVNVYIENISRYREKLKELDEQYSVLKDNLEEENNKLEDLNRASRHKTGYAKVLEEKLESAREEYRSLEAGVERSVSEIRLNEEKINNNLRNISRLDNEINEIKIKIEELDCEIAKKNRKLAYLNQQREEYSAKLADGEKRLKSIIAALDEREKHIEEIKSGIMDKLDILSDKKTQINNIRLHMENIARRQKSIDGEIYQLALENDRERMKKEDLCESVRKAKEYAGKLAKDTEELDKKKAGLDIELEKQKKAQISVKSDLQFKTSRYRMLKEMEQNLEGYQRSVRALLKACKASESLGKGIKGALAQLIGVDREYETAIEMALGNALQNVVAETEEDAQRAIGYLKENRLGRVTFLPVSSVKGRYIEKETYDRIKSHEGFCGVASDLVIYDPLYTGIVLSLLGKVVVVRNLNSGIQMAKKFGYSFRIVTLEGDIISTTGAMTGGSVEAREAGILGRSREIAELEGDIGRLESQSESIENAIKGLIGEINNIASAISSMKNSIRDGELAIIRDESHLAQIDANMKKNTAKIDMLRQEKEQLLRQEKEIESEIKKYIDEQARIENEISESRKYIAEYQEKHKEEQQARDALHSDIAGFRISVNSIAESIMDIKESTAKILSEKENLIRGINRRLNEKNRNDEDMRKLKEENQGMDVQIKKYEEEKNGKTFEIDRISEERKVLEEELLDISNRINDINGKIMVLKDEFGKIDIKRVRLETEMETLQNRLWDEYELTYAKALELKKDIGNIAQAQKRIIELKNMIKELGTVNVASIDEYVKTRERYEFMKAQRDDLENAREKLQRVIYEMTSLMKKQFTEQLKLINQNFNAVFKELFDGGHAKLKLSDEDNVLESDIEIEAQPPGKKLQNMMLLSGGERALTAIAILFSILRLKPAPFCILDEIEAALDDANVYRFTQYLRRYAHQIQFIIVTHRKGTMEASDMLYGVTMQEHGISKIVSLKMDETKAG